MTPERADMILTGMARSLANWIEELEELQADCPQVRHLLNQLRQSRVSLRQMMDRGEGRE